MFFESIATVFAGLAMAGIVMAVNHTIRGRLPKWVMPVAAGLAMLAATIANEYAWYGRTVDSLPEGLTVIMESENRVAYRPWTYVTPFIDRFVVVDTFSERTHPDQPNLRVVDTLFLGRWSAPNKVPVLIDCAANTRAPLSDAITIGDDGSLSGVDWVSVDMTDPLLSNICHKGG
ncbi:MULTISPECIES: hypothetical protein [unclassified Aliiroseovarius]|uniref:hypothetical protein n=1 Tax=unclassified Aliiroseovarius TaxID=2623558 RepID=UPI001568D064|nr:MULTISPECIES: hypothetical protein [unclassified Aliiroseovarius]NRP13538.1 hypothetical protein [Aliiroseovarius sp. xm-d-517]NRP41322.1 hypothetical protein [Aliiroseovarius sp. xm-m-339-2]NRP62185.1 hypothetical protein [Aliiroseovarius sp. xm-a-151]